MRAQIISLFDPGNSKNACHIQRLYDATASKLMVGSWIWPQYWPFHAAGQFFYFQCMQSMLPSIPWNQHPWPWANNLAMFLLFRDLKYYLEKILITIATNFFWLFIAMVSPIHTYSSIKSAITPYTSIPSANVIFWREDKLSFWALSLFLDKVRFIRFYLRLNMEKKRTIHLKSPPK